MRDSGRGGKGKGEKTREKEGGKTGGGERESTREREFEAFYFNESDLPKRLSQKDHKFQPSLYIFAKL